DSLLRSLNPPSPEIDRQWILAAKRRLAELRSGAAESIPGEDVFSRVSV
ncbi:MAG: addiction module protein, partial [bacterium]|nr:addiction module protein [bacterium]